MLHEVVYQRLAMAVDDGVLSTLRLELGCYEVDPATAEGRRSAQLLSRLFRRSWRRLGEELGERLVRDMLPHALRGHQDAIELLR
jgi:hypothetical protein